MDNEANIPEDYNNPGIDVTTTDRSDAENCVLCNLKDRIQNNKSLLEATRTAEKIGDATPMIINSIYKAKEEVEENTRNPKYIDADTIKGDMQDERTIDDINFNTGINVYSDEFNQQVDVQFNQQGNGQLEQQSKGQFRQQRNIDWER